MGRALKIALALVAALAAVACVALHVQRGLAAGAGSWAAGEFRATTAEASRRVAWREPVPFATDLAASGGPTRIALAPDGTRAVVAHGERGRDASLWFVELDPEGRVLRERPIAEIDAPGDEISPWFDGRTLWFASDRAGGSGGFDLWSASCVAGRFEPAERLPDGANSAGDDVDPTVHGSELVCASDRDGRGFDLYATDTARGGVERLDALSTAADEREPAFAPDGGSIWFVAGSSQGFAIQRAFRTGDRWLPPECVEDLDGAGSERAVVPSRDGFEITFLRDGAPFRASSVELGLVPPLAWTWAELLLLASLIALAAGSWLARDVARYDLWIAAWAISVLIHVLLLLLFGGLRLQGGGPEARDEPDATIRVRLAPGIDGLASAREGGLRLERAEFARTVASAELDARTDLVEAIAAARERAAEPERRAVATRAPPDEPRTIDEPEASAPPRAEAIDAPLPTMPGPGRTARTRDSAPALPERYAGRGATSSAVTLGPSEAPVVEIGGAPAELPEVARASESPLPAATTPRELRESEPTTPTAAAPSAAQSSDAFVARVPSSATRPAEDLSPERYSSARPARGSDLRAPRSSLASTPSRVPVPELEPPPRIASTPYQTRIGPAKERALEEHGGTAETEAAVARGLRYLAGIQGRLGQWGPLEHRDPKYGEICVGKTALATLAFLAAGHTHVSATEHSAVVQRALAFLLATQDAESGHYGDTSAYGHGLATFALAEALAITGDASLRTSVVHAVAHVLDRQSRAEDPRKRGGWPYFYVDPEREFDPWPRTSITAWQVLALESARLSGVEVPDAAFDEAARFLEASRQPRADWYRYSHDPTRLRSGYPTLPASTPAALFALSCIGRDIRGAEHAAARDYVLERAPRGYRFTNERDFVERAQGNPYFWYQGTLAMFRVGGPAWRRWNAALQETLLPAQEPDGSWRPIDVYARYAEDSAADRAYTTALCVLCLEVYYRYDLPLLSAGRPPAEPR